MHRVLQIKVPNLPNWRRMATEIANVKPTLTKMSMGCFGHGDEGLVTVIERPHAKPRLGMWAWRQCWTTCCLTVKRSHTAPSMHLLYLPSFNIYILPKSTVVDATRTKRIRRMGTNGIANKHQSPTRRWGKAPSEHGRRDEMRVEQQSEKRLMSCMSSQYYSELPREDVPLTRDPICTDRRRQRDENSGMTLSLGRDWRERSIRRRARAGRKCCGRHGGGGSVDHDVQRLDLTDSEGIA
ncbi:hypothetical protein M433DRAFT_435196 [Acidomyces richmondensis BFW]|nr:MAG: hypothetical protein FE78DRAFT_239527 [Acidomyces sp. 'richmondensis']KYG48250.1 hypothetical protein M433DRAFT_435196 [Acidomyces richmondensis BFW]